MSELIVRGESVVTPSGVVAASIHIREGRIEAVRAYDDVPAEAPVIDYGALTISPGVVDSHVHVNEPGRTEWEGFVTATQAAAAGGVTTLIDMPLNSIPCTTSVEALLAKAEAMEDKCWIDVGLWGGAVPGNAGDLRPMLAAGALGFKCFLIDCGIAEFGHLDAAGLEEALEALAGSGAPLLVHAELPGPIAAAAAELRGDRRSYRRYLQSRPRTAEDQAIELVYSACAERGGRAHIVHLSSSGGLELLRRARDERVPLTAETTPHYLHFAAERIPDGATEYKCAPPIREHDNREQLWRGLDEELLMAVVSDHSPCTPELKKLEEGDFADAWGGIASLQFALPIVWSGARKRGLGLVRMAELMSEGPARLAGLGSRKGRIATGYDADLVVWSPDESFIVDPALIRHRHKVTPYMGAELFGTVQASWVRGRRVFDDGSVEEHPHGRWCRRP